MTKLSTRKTLGNTRFYIQYFDQSGEKITLSLRSEKSYQNHLQQYKISENRIIYKSNVRPWNPESQGSFKSHRNYLSGRETTRRGLGGA